MVIFVVTVLQVWVVGAHVGSTVGANTGNVSVRGIGGGSSATRVGRHLSV